MKNFDRCRVDGLGLILEVGGRCETERIDQVHFHCTVLYNSQILLIKSTMSSSVQLYSLYIYSQKIIPSIYNSFWTFISNYAFNIISSGILVSYKSECIVLIQYFSQAEALENNQSKHCLFLSLIYHPSIHPNIHWVPTI